MGYKRERVVQDFDVPWSEGGLDHPIRSCHVQLSLYYFNLLMVFRPYNLTLGTRSTKFDHGASISFYLVH